MTRNLKRSLPLIVVFQVGLLLPAFAQQDQPSGTGTTTVTGNTTRTGANSNAAAATSSFNATTSPSVANSGNVMSLPNGRRVSRSNSTVTLCDAPGSPFPDAVDVCNLK